MHSSINENLVCSRLEVQARGSRPTIFLQHKYNYNKILYLSKNFVIIVGIGNQCDK